MTTAEILKDVIKELSKNDTFFTYIYYFFSIFFLVYSKKYTVESIIMINQHKEEKQLYLDNTIKIYDDCIYISKFKIPYEYIVEVGYNGKYNYLVVMANFVCKDRTLNINLSLNDTVQINMIDNRNEIYKSITENMLYHIRFHNININIIPALQRFKKTN